MAAEQVTYGGPSHRISAPRSRVRGAVVGSVGRRGVLLGRPARERESVKRALELIRKQLIHLALPLDAVEPLECRRHHLHTEMRLLAAEAVDVAVAVDRTIGALAALPDAVDGALS